MLENEIAMCNTLARVLRIRCAVVQIGSLILALDAKDVEPHETVLYMTI